MTTMTPGARFRAALKEEKKGTCQGGFCIYRLLGVLHDLKMLMGDSNSILKGFLEERWKGIRPILWGTTLKEDELIESIYKGIFNLCFTFALNE